MQKSPGSRALWRSGLFSLCAGALISLVLLRFLSQLDQPGLTPEDLRPFRCCPGPADSLDQRGCHRLCHLHFPAHPQQSGTGPHRPHRILPHLPQCRRAAGAWYSAARRQDGS